MRTRRPIIATLAATLAASGLLIGSGALGQDDQLAKSSTALPGPFTARLACGQDDGLNEAGTATELPDDPGTSVSTIPRTIWRFPTLQVSDPRMGGRVYGYLAGTGWSNESWPDEVGVYSALWRVVNDGGEWIGP